jgi:rRNA maturation protein Nop10
MNYYPMRCPVCGEQNAVPLQELAVRGRTMGRDVECAHCGADLYLNHTRPTLYAEPEWRLEKVLPLSK